MIQLNLVTKFLRQNSHSEINSKEKALAQIVKKEYTKKLEGGEYFRIVGCMPSFFGRIAI